MGVESRSESKDCQWGRGIRAQRGISLTALHNDHRSRTSSTRCVRRYREDNSASNNSLGVLVGVSLVVDFRAFWNKAFASLLTTTTDNIATAFGSHPRTKSVLTFSGALGRLISPFHLGS